MKVKTRILAGFMASIFMLSSFSGNVSAASHDHDHVLTTVDTSLIGISTKDASDLIDLISGAYLNAYKINVSSYEAVGGDETKLQFAFDNDWTTQWYATDNTQASSITVTFDEISEISRILYGVRSNAYDPDGYPTKLAIAVSKTDNGDDFVEVAATTSEATLNKVLFTLAEPVEAKRIKFIFKEAYEGFASAAELMFLKPDPIFETVHDLFENEASRQLKEKYQNDEIFDTLEAQAKGHVARDYLVDKIRFARKAFTGEITAENPIDFPIEVIQKTGPDSEKYVMLFVPDRYTVDEQDKFYEDVKSLAQNILKWDPYSRYADDINIYALKVPSNEVKGNNYFVDSYFKTIVYPSEVSISVDGRNRINELIQQLENNYLDKGGKISVVNVTMNYQVGAGRAFLDGSVPISLQSFDQPDIMLHELSHGVGLIGDEYPSNHTVSYLPNLTNESDGAKAPWKEFLGFRGVTQRYVQSGIYRSSAMCNMVSSSAQFCEWCKLLLSEQINEKLANKKELYIANPIFTVPHEEYYNYQAAGTILAENGNYKKVTRKELDNNYITDANGKDIEFRTVVKNFTDKTKYLTLKMYVISSDGNKRDLGSNDFTVNPKEIKSLVVVNDKLSGLQQGDRISGELINTDTGTVLMNADTYLKKYGTVTIKYKVGDQTQKTNIDLPNVEQRELRLEANSTYQLKPAEIKGYEYTGKSITEPSVQIEEGKNIEVTYYYTKDKGKVTLNLVDDNNTVTKSVYRYIGKDETFTPSQSDFPAKKGYKLVLPKSVTFDGVNDLNLTYSYAEGEPEPTPVDTPKKEISQGETPTSAVPVTPAPVTPTPAVPVTPTPVTPTPVVPVTPTPVTPTPVVPVTPTPVTPTPVVPVTPTPVTPTPVVPVTPTPVTPTPVVPVTPTPVTPTPVVPVTPNPVTPTPDDNVKQEDDIPIVDKEIQKDEEDKNSKVFSFTDVKAVEGNWKYDSVKYVYENNIMNGSSDTNLFEPESSLTRSMFATVLYRMAGNPTIAYTDTFSDVAAGKWYSEAILWANQEGIVSGLADGQYGIDVNITREQIAKMLYEYAKQSGYDISGEATLDDFTDKDSVSGWATDYMKWAASAGMISGKPNGDGSYRLDPKGEATRAECAAMLTRFIKKYQEVQ